MAETIIPTEPQTDPAPEAEAPDTVAEAEADAPELDGDALRAELKAVRAEAAKYRTKARETAEALKSARSPAEFQAVADRAAELETSLHRERLGRKYGLPDALAARIGGADDDAREADAKALAEIFHSRGVGIGRGGLDPSATPVSNDPAELAAGIPRARR
ncbi:hypothetical protein [Streptomyces sp. NPDC002067]